MTDSLISPSYKLSDFPGKHSIETKIILFEDRLLGWKLDIADQIINGKQRSDMSPEIQPIRNGGYAALDIVFSYFEMIAKYHDGFVAIGESRDYFKKGAYLVFSGLENNPKAEIEWALNLMYDGIRCGLYHSGRTDGRIVLAEYHEPYILNVGKDPHNSDKFLVLFVNPKLLIQQMKGHLSEYISDLKDVNNHKLRKNFEARYDFDDGIRFYRYSTNGQFA